jgi:hypothetical protein
VLQPMRRINHAVCSLCRSKKWLPSLRTVCSFAGSETNTHFGYRKTFKLACLTFPYRAQPLTNLSADQTVAKVLCHGCSTHGSCAVRWESIHLKQNIGL